MSVGQFVSRITQKLMEGGAQPRDSSCIFFTFFNIVRLWSFNFLVHFSGNNAQSLNKTIRHIKVPDTVSLSEYSR